MPSIQVRLTRLIKLRFCVNFFDLEFSEFFVLFRLLYLNKPKLKVKYLFMIIVYCTQTPKNLLWSHPNQETVRNHYAGVLM